jgi:hypothetical protein
MNGCILLLAVTNLGRAFALVWMFIGLGVISILTGTMSAELSGAAVNGNIRSIYDLKPSNRICTPSPLYQADYLVNYNVGSYLAPSQTLQECFHDVKHGRADAVFYDETALQYGLSRNLELSDRFKVLPTENTIVLGSVFPKTLSARPNKFRFDEIFLNFREREKAKLATLYQKYFPKSNYNEQKQVQYNWAAIGFASIFVVLYATASIYDSYLYGDLDFIVPSHFKRHKAKDCDKNENNKIDNDKNNIDKDEGDGNKIITKKCIDSNKAIDIEMVDMKVMDSNSNDKHFNSGKHIRLNLYNNRKRRSTIVQHYHQHPGHARPVHLDSPEFVRMSNGIDYVHEMIQYQKHDLEKILSLLHVKEKNGNEQENKGNEQEEDRQGGGGEDENNVKSRSVVNLEVDKVSYKNNFDKSNLQQPQNVTIDHLSITEMDVKKKKVPDLTKKYEKNAHKISTEKESESEDDMI